MLLILNVGKGSKMKYNKATIFLKYLHYLLNASNGRGHGIHSPFVFSFIKKVLNNKTEEASSARIERYRSKLFKNEQAITLLDHGIGEKFKNNKFKKYNTLLIRILTYFKPNTVLEMGTSIGITTCYLAQALPLKKIVTMEEVPELAKLASCTFQHLGYTNIQLIEGRFDMNLPLYLNEIEKLGIVFINGKNRYQPTMNYFQNLLSKSNQDSIFIFGDIHSSVEMEKAWEEIKNNNSVSLTIDLFYLGIVFFKKENKQKENYLIRF